jgi:hypothetical protein
MLVEISRYFFYFFLNFLICWLLLTTSAWGQPVSTTTPLTLEELEAHLEQPVQQEGVVNINLSHFEIDLTADSEFQEQFYQLLQTKLNRSKQSLGLDLSQSVIKGELDFQQLSLQTPLVGEALSPLLSELEKERLQENYELQSLANPEQLSQSVDYGNVFRGVLTLVDTQFEDDADFSNIFFLQRVDAAGVSFAETSDWSNDVFSRKVDFSQADFIKDTDFSNSQFGEKAKFNQAKFKEITNFSGVLFEDEVDFSQAEFSGVGNWLQSRFEKVGIFVETVWRDRALFSKSRFLGSLQFNNATFEKSVAFRQSRFNDVINLEGVSILEQVDFSNAVFTENAYLDVSGLAFDSDSAKILGEVGVIGKAVNVPVLEGNENVLQGLVRNFRDLEQIPDANQIEYRTETLRLQQLGTRLISTPIKRLLSFSKLGDGFHWLGLSVLLLLSDYGTNFSLVFGIGLLSMACFGVLFWFIDRYRRLSPNPIIPTTYETISILISFTMLILVSVATILQASQYPLLTLACIGLIIIPVPLSLSIYLYLKDPNQRELNTTYFVEDGGTKQLHLLIVRLPVIPRFGFWRNRYLPILTSRRWNWLNYYDFSLNNFIKLGFNDIRLRDHHVPGIITTLVWYQWSLGILYVALLLWTLSRTIPGLNLLIYLK